MSALGKGRRPRGDEGERGGHHGTGGHSAHRAGGVQGHEAPGREGHGNGDKDHGAVEDVVQIEGGGQSQGRRRHGKGDPGSGAAEREQVGQDARQIEGAILPPLPYVSQQFPHGGHYSRRDRPN